MKKQTGLFACLVGLAILSGLTQKVLATPATGFTATTVALGRFGATDALNVALPATASGSTDAKAWLSLQRTQGDSDLYVQSNTWVVGGSTGWHTHPGHSLIIVTAGEVTVYEGDEPDCKPHVYKQGMGFLDGGGEHRHIIRNEGTVEARTIAVQLIPAGATRRIDVDPPAQCRFSPPY